MRREKPSVPKKYIGTLSLQASKIVKQNDTEHKTESHLSKLQDDSFYAYLPT